MTQPCECGHAQEVHNNQGCTMKDCYGCYKFKLDASMDRKYDEITKEKMEEIANKPRPIVSHKKKLPFPIIQGNRAKKLLTEIVKWRFIEQKFLGEGDWCDTVSRKLDRLTLEAYDFLTGNEDVP